MSYTRRKIEGGVGALRESHDTNFLKSNGQSRIFNVYAALTWKLLITIGYVLKIIPKKLKFWLKTHKNAWQTLP